MKSALSEPFRLMWLLDFLSKTNQNMFTLLRLFVRFPIYVPETGAESTLMVLRINLSFIVRGRRCSFCLEISACAMKTV